MFAGKWILLWGRRLQKRTGKSEGFNGKLSLLELSIVSCEPAQESHEISGGKGEPEVGDF